MNALLFLQTPILPRRPFGQPAGVDLGVDPMAYEWLHLGVRAALDSNREDARYYFVQAVRTDLNFARAWLYLGGVAEDAALTLSCVQKVLQIDPGEAQARTALLWAREKLGLPPVLPAWEMMTTSPPTPPLRREGSRTYTAAPTSLPTPPLKGEGSRAAAPARSLQWGGLSAPTGTEREADQPVVPRPPADVIWGTLLPPRAGDRTGVAVDASPLPVPPVPPWTGLPTLPPLPPARPLPELPPLPLPLRSSAVSAQLAMPLLVNPRPAPSPAAPPTPARAPLPVRPLPPAAMPLDDARADGWDSNGLVQRGVQSAALGNRARARYYFLKAIAADAGNTRAWLYLGGVAGDPSLTLACLERVLRVEPWNREARAGAEWAVSQLGISSPALLWWK